MTNLTQMDKMVSNCRIALDEKIKIEERISDTITK